MIEVYMKTEQEKIEEMAKVIQKIYITKISRNEYCLAQDIYKAGYRKASDVIDEFVARVKERLEEFTKQDYEDGVPYYHADCEQIDNVIDDVADEMRQEVEK